jgi:hypothetical protein
VHACVWMNACACMSICRYTTVHIYRSLLVTAQGSVKLYLTIDGGSIIIFTYIISDVSVKIWLLSYRGSAKKITGPAHYVLTQTCFGQRGHAKVPSAASETWQQKFPTHLSSPHSSTATPYSSHEENTPSAPRSPAGTTQEPRRRRRRRRPCPFCCRRSPHPICRHQTSALALHRHHGHWPSTPLPALQELHSRHGSAQAEGTSSCHVS